MNRLVTHIAGALTLGALLTSCAAGTECERELLEDGRFEVTCPRLDPVVLEQVPADPDAACVRLEQTITCGDQRFDLGGKVNWPRVEPRDFS